MKIQEYLRSEKFTVVKVDGMTTVTKGTAKIKGGDQWELFYSLVGRDVPSTFNWSARMTKFKMSENVVLLKVTIKDF